VNRPVITSLRPVRGWVEPGAWVRATAGISSSEPTSVRVSLRLLDLDRAVAATSVEVRLEAGTTSVELGVRAPGLERRGYGLEAAVYQGEAMVASALDAVEVLTGPWRSPRHAAVIDYSDPAISGPATGALVDWHVNMAQHYDWMWRHYRYRPPDRSTEFVDALGRMVSHRALRASIDHGHAAGIAALAYGSVYGAETEYVERHPDERVFDAAGQPLSLGGTFHINDIRPGSSWRSRLLAEYTGAIEHFGFDGIHMDTYGPPHAGFAADGTPIDFAQLYPGLIDEAARVSADTAAGARVLFNCVEGFPLAAVAPADAAALYLELWPPDDGLDDVVRWVDRARALARGRAVIIAAYAAAMREEGAMADRAAAFEATLLLGSVIAAAGAYHHTLAAGDRLLVEGYYPAAVPMEPGEIAELRALSRFSARYVHLLSDPGSGLVELPGLELRDRSGAPVAWSSEPRPGVIWARAFRTPEHVSVLHLIDLRDQDDVLWTRPKRTARVRAGLAVRWPHASERARVASPWSRDGSPVVVAGRDGWLALPADPRWQMLVATDRADRSADGPQSAAGT